MRAMSAPATVAALAAALAGCAGSSAPSAAPFVSLPPAPAPTASSTNPPSAAATRPCEHPNDAIRTALAAQLSSQVEVTHAAMVQTHATIAKAPVYYLAGLASRGDNRVGIAVWASSTPMQSGSWAAVDAAAATVSVAPSAAGTPAALSRNVVDYSHVSACANLGY